MDFEFSKHAEEQMLLRNIKQNDVLNTLIYPDQIVKDDDNQDVKIYQSLLKENSQMFLLRVFVNIYKTPKSVITVYKTTKISKYYES